MQPEIHLNYLAILAGVLSNIAIGFLWYGPLFGKAWAAEMGFPKDMKPDNKQMIKSLVLMVIGSFLTAYVLAHSVDIWRPSSWKVGQDQPAWTYGFFAAFFTWIGYYVPLLFGSVSWEGRSWKLFSINAAYYFVSLQTIGMILAYWRL
ncbi:PF08570 family protein [Leptospira broomii serovar Hurstbridge str. 5399]|uniref:PF08570 family protein n=1 Tax=Leptospira broomii serovar Hurstbridge str. 5399 TaxID=1049789 RepID=T0F112_9LEPT|nr:DUF1761 domain-containing protein [Leptospira broomii]EQA44845.1 PF08570 family protein [Leptospira broomii serovar Hurstbridge str. 5399]